MDPLFLSLEEILTEHQELIKRYGGSHGLRDQGALESAINMPRQAFGGTYLHEDLFSMAAAYLFHLVENHPFVDGNKRIGTYAALLFLDINGVELVCDPDELADLTLEVAKGRHSKDEIAAFFREKSHTDKPATSKLLTFKIDKENADGIQTSILTKDGKVSQISRSAENVINGYVPRHQWSQIDPSFRKQFKIEEYTEATERMHGYTIQIRSELSSEPKTEDYHRAMKRDAVLDADYYINQGGKGRRRWEFIINIFDPSGKEILKTIDEDGLYVPAEIEQRLVDFIARHDGKSERQVLKDLVMIGDDWLYPSPEVIRFMKPRQRGGSSPDTIFHKLERDQELKSLGFKFTATGTGLYIKMPK